MQLLVQTAHRVSAWLANSCFTKAPKWTAPVNQVLPFPQSSLQTRRCLGWWEYVAFLTWGWSCWLMTFILRTFTLFLWPFSMRATYHLYSFETETAEVTEASVLHVEDRGYFHCGRNGLHESGWWTCSQDICSLQVILFLIGDYVLTSTCLNSIPVPVCYCFQAICCQIQASKSMITFTKKVYKTCWEISKFSTV